MTAKSEDVPVTEGGCDHGGVDRLSYLAGWNDARAGRQYGEGPDGQRVASTAEIEGSGLPSQGGADQATSDGPGPSLDEPSLIDLIAELRRTVGLFAGAMPITPKAAWDEAIERVRLLTSGWCYACIGNTVDSTAETVFTQVMTTAPTNTVHVTFDFTTQATQDEAVLRRSMRDTLDAVADRYAGSVTAGSVLVEVNREATVVSRFKSLMADLVDEGTDPDAITEALAYLGFGKAVV